MSRICACTVPRGPVSHHRRCAGVSDSGALVSSARKSPIRCLISSRARRRSWYGPSSATFSLNSASAAVSSQFPRSRLTSLAAASVSGQGAPAGGTGVADGADGESGSAGDSATW